MQSPYRFIAIEGNIGSGKTSFSKLLAEKLRANLILEEFDDNSFLKQFYKNPDRYAFPLEVSFLVERFEQMKRAFEKADLFKPSFVSDYMFDKSLIFAKNNLAEDQFPLFQSLFQNFKSQIQNPDLLLYLHRPVNELLLNIESRGRSFEQQIESSYLEGVHSSYFDYFRQMHKKRILIVNVAGYDFLEDEKSLEALFRITTEPFKSKTHIIKLSDWI